MKVTILLIVSCCAFNWGVKFQLFSWELGILPVKAMQCFMPISLLKIVVLSLIRRAVAVVTIVTCNR